MVSVQEMSAKIRETTPSQRSVAAATALALLAFFFSIGGVAGVWWAGSFEIGQSRTTVQVEFVSTLWETTTTVSVHDQSKEETHTIDDTCGGSNLNDEAESRCSKIGAVRAFVVLKFIVCLASVACPLSWLCVGAFQKGDVAGRLQKGLLIAAVSCNAVASLCALLAVIIASTLDFSDLNENVGVNGGGFVFTILSMVLCLVPGTALVALAWRWTYLLPAETSTPARPADLPKVADLPNLVSTKPSESEVSKTQHGGDIEAAAAGRKQTTV